MKKVNTLGILGLLSLLVIVPVLIITKLIPSETHYKTVKFSSVEIKAEVADTPLKRAEGLMSKKSLPADEGMLFIFNNADYHGIWMMNMSFSIDILWIDKDLKIVDIMEDAQPCTFNCPIYTPSEKAAYVLEVNSGFVKQNGIKTGDTIRIT